MTAAAPAVTPTLGQSVRRLRFWGVGAAVVLLLAVVALLSRAGGGTGTAFGPDNAAPAGARALRAVLEQQGVQVTRATRLTDVPQGGTLLVDDRDGLLPARAWRELLARSDRLVVVQPGATALGQVLPGTSAAGFPDGTTVQPGCGSALAARAGALALSGATHSLRSAGRTACYSDGAGRAQLVAGRNGATSVVLLADALPFENEHIATAGNGAVALNVLGARSALTWYTPSPLDTALGARPTVAQLTPGWVTPVALLLLLSGITAAFWRGRRLGPLVVEQLPVVVRSRETVEGRARLYARSGSRLRAADALRIGALGRIAPLLGLSRTAGVDELAAAAAAATGRPLAAVRALLLDATPASDSALVRLSDDLARLEADVRRAVAP
ncbi:DUF4350 domain-containing protein [Amnibacterium sp. CER49]|uniref:DUF4350 domain-containing protein n=1 Tax=Amnibacterium sp. CER49 TaxID=3039161 RepID=UPI00244D4019|nr:DUF4350 domain-containing protein [Amnibacterium sp. CER49]MDH2442955.1 DUF4350 domain-containing protein [Amnibacterium sp. CER49]